jgi:hypothetical protein
MYDEDDYSQRESYSDTTVNLDRVFSAAQRDGKTTIETNNRFEMVNPDYCERVVNKIRQIRACSH